MCIKAKRIIFVTCIICLFFGMSVFADTLVPATSDVGNMESGVSGVDEQIESVSENTNGVVSTQKKETSSEQGNFNSNEETSNDSELEPEKTTSNNNDSSIISGGAISDKNVHEVLEKSKINLNAKMISIVKGVILTIIITAIGVIVSFAVYKILNHW